MSASVGGAELFSDDGTVADEPRAGWEALAGFGLIGNVILPPGCG